MIAKSHRRQRLAFLDRPRHRGAHEIEKACAILGIGNALSGEGLGGSKTQKRRFELWMRAHGLAYVSLLVAHLPGKPRALGKELDFLHHPARAVRVVLLLPEHATLGVALAGSDRHRSAARSARAHEIAHLRLCLARRDRALEILTPERALTATRQELDVVGLVLAAAELIASAAVLGEATDEELLAARPSTNGPAWRWTPDRAERMGRSDPVGG
ncbi:MAG: hypothetical protein ACREU2_17085 [Steroidobacteraceae bacterium]